ncbi:MAG: hypothetical protein GWP11_06625 [Proteobacteria bacterium]|nr:hypothetical protein [Pseudomonadota bacterium]
MITEMRRSKRYNDFIAISIIAHNGIRGETKAGPFSGRIINISRHGACLLMPRVENKSYHLFHSTRQDDSSFLELKGTIQRYPDKFRIPARPVWLESFNMDDIEAFNMGVEFMLSPEGERMTKIIEAVNKK